jgi:hypothetical protein
MASKVSINCQKSLFFKEVMHFDLWGLELCCCVLCRAEFDIYHSTKAGGLPVDSQMQVDVSCTFCNGSVLAKNPLSQPVKRFPYSRGKIPSNKVKVSLSIFYRIKAKWKYAVILIAITYAVISSIIMYIY